MFEHLFVSAILLYMSTCAPGFIAGSFLVDRGVQQALAWLEPEEVKLVSTVPTTIGERVKGLVNRVGQVGGEMTYAVTKEVTVVLARFMVWVVVFVGLLVWALFELRLAMSHLFNGVVSGLSRLFLKR
jgi:hypothetical protein